MGLSDYSKGELRDELARREKAEAERPKLIESPELTHLINMTESIINEVVHGTYTEDNDDAQYIYEEVMSAFYGRGFWDWFNRNAY